MQKIKVFAALALLVCAVQVQAQPIPKITAPMSNAVLQASPAEIQMTFNEGLVLVSSGLELDDAKGKVVQTSDAILDSNDDKVMIVQVMVKLAPGTYTVKWHALGKNNRRMIGHYSFQVKM